MSKEEMKPYQSMPLWRNRDYLLLWSGQGISLPYPESARRGAYRSLGPQASDDSL
jgi:hypothetical protein